VTNKKSQQGFTLIEVILTFSILAIATTALGLVELSNARRQQDLKARDIAFTRGQAIMERILRMPFGTPDAMELTDTQYDSLFATDSDVRSMSLTQIQQKDANDDGNIDVEPISFKLEGVEDNGTWEVFVDNDLDGNGRIEPIIDGVETREGRSDLLRIEIRRNGRTVIRTIRARTPQEQDAADTILE
jgi:prepilin-type N-terminal cleavage/methylation domain-containing protein